MPQGIDLVEEQHTRGIAAGVVEDRADAALAFPQPPVQHIGDTDMVEAGTQLTRNRLGDMGFAAPRRSVQQQPAARRYLERLHQIRVAYRAQQRKFKLLFDIGHAGDVGEPHVAALQHVVIAFVDHVSAVLYERRFDDVGDLFLRAGPIELRLNPLGRRQRRATALRQAQCVHVAGITGQCGAAVSQSFGVATLVRQQPRQVHPQLDHLRAALDRGRELPDDRVVHHQPMPLARRPSSRITSR